MTRPSVVMLACNFIWVFINLGHVAVAARCLFAFFVEVHLPIFECCFAAVISVEPTYSYYEKVSEELEKIVHEVKEKEEVQPLTDGKDQFLFTLIKQPYKV